MLALELRLEVLALLEEVLPLLLLDALLLGRVVLLAVALGRLVAVLGRVVAPLVVALGREVVALEFALGRVVALLLLVALRPPLPLLELMLPAWLS